MLHFPPHIKFKHPWRKYQQKVLTQLETHLKDNHLHIIAPPGSGKTILGLEVAIRINKPTLILVPTLAIRNQWIQRFCELFLDKKILPTWISKDIRQPQFLTVVTYQGLHAACSSPQGTTTNLAHITDLLRAQHIGTIVVDEAHHLKNEWWHTLHQIKAIIQPTIVGLTATPPYDVSALEWQRYTQLNGPIDIEISVPELIKEGNLCPHQDYVYFTWPTPEEDTNITLFRQNIERVFHTIKNDNTLLEAVIAHPFWHSPEEHLEWIYANISYYSAALIFLHDHAYEIPQRHLEIIGDTHLKIPTLNYEWVQVLLQFYLHSDDPYFQAYKEHQETTKSLLRRNGALEKKVINFSHSKLTKTTLTSSISKLNAIQHIVQFEYKQLRSQLRLVVLTDYIRKEFLVHDDVNYLELNKLGAIPIFEKIRRENHLNTKVGVLTGSVVIIPAQAQAAFLRTAKQHHITDISTKPLSYDKDYLIIQNTSQVRQVVVDIITQIFQEGEIEVLIGTKALLGEGWDAPSINTLILASFIGSFVSSNQMRGRAIRAITNNKNKTANIWHIICTDHTTPTGGSDFELLRRRFKSFVGIGNTPEMGIQNGIARLNLPPNFIDEAEMQQFNQHTFSIAQQRDLLHQNWAAAIEEGLSLVEEIKIPFAKKRSYRHEKSIYFTRTIANMAATLGLSVFEYMELVLDAFSELGDYFDSLDDVLSFFSIAGAGGVLFFGRRSYLTLKIYIKYRDIAKDIHQIGVALLQSLLKANIITTPEDKLQVVSSIDKRGAVFCYLRGGNTFEQSTFINALEQIVSPITNPRYIIIRYSRLFKIRQKDYHAVPEILAKKKFTAQLFRREWAKHVGACGLVFTRTVEGRQLLLQSRIQSLSAQFLPKIEHINKWKL